MGKHRTKNRNRTHQKNKLNSKLKKHSSQRKKSTKKRGTKKKRGGARGLKALGRAAALSAALAGSQMIPGAHANRFTLPIKPHDPYAPNNGLKEIGPWTSSSRQSQYASSVNRYLSPSVISDTSPNFPSHWVGMTKEEINLDERRKEREVIRLRQNIAKEWENLYDPAISVENKEFSEALLKKLIQKAEKFKSNRLAWNWEPTDTQWKMAYEVRSDYLTNNARTAAETKWSWVPLERAFTPDHNRMEDKWISLGTLVESIQRGETPHWHPSFQSYFIWREPYKGRK